MVHILVIPLNIMKQTTLSASARANIAFVELIDNFKTNIYTRTAFVNGDHRYFRFNPSFGFVRSYLTTHHYSLIIEKLIEHHHQSS